MKWSLLALLIGFIIDCFVGDPHGFPHPIILIGKLISTLEKWLRRLFPATPRGERAAGAVLWLLTVGLSTAVPALILVLCHQVSPWLRLAVESIMCWQILAARALKEESMLVYKALESGDIVASRRAVSMIVGRDTAALDDAAVTRAAVETVAENTSDGVVAPLLFLAIGGAPLGFFYKAVNTMDSMLGYTEPPFKDIGLVSAKADDVVNYLPARLSALEDDARLLGAPAPKTAREALARLRQVGIPQDFLTNCYVVDEEGLLLGLLTVRTLLTLPERTRLDQAAEAPKAVLAPQEDQERAAALLDQLEVSELPVADGSGRLVGTFTAEDALGVLKEEATEDMERMAAIQPSERPYLLTRVLDLYRHRVVWLLLLMISASFTGAIITYFEDALAAQVALTAFIPMLMDTGGNCGSQSSVTVIRSLSLGELRLGDWWRASWKELQVGVLCGVTLALVNLARLTLFSQVGTAVALVVSLTLIVTVVSSKLLGCLLPIAASRLGMDPAVMASPLITTIADAVSLLVYFRIAVLLLAI